ncbi:hypothetical protein PF003_g38743 [Phytophthora fragariae]|nr:hypothetical protein PF003_g38743 [Phytophthora fragariae]
MYAVVDELHDTVRAQRLQQVIHVIRDPFFPRKPATSLQAFRNSSAGASLEIAVFHENPPKTWVSAWGPE